MPLLKKHIFLYCIYVLLGSVGLFTTPPSAYALQCPAPELGPACENQSAPWLLPVAGNPIHLINGNNYLQHHDLYPHPKTPLLYVQRHYNAQALHHSILGRGWALHWDIRLQKNNQQLWLADGRRITFNPKKLQLNQNPNDLRLGKYQLQLGQHTTLWFNQQGYLIRLKENLPTQHRPTLLEIKRYAPNHPTLANQIKSLKQGQKQIKLNYHTHSATKKNERPHQHPPLLSKINSPFGEILYHYQWDHQTQQPKLKQVHYPDKRKILYHYEQPEHPFALTGVSIQLKNQKPIRIRYWWY